MRIFSIFCAYFCYAQVHMTEHIISDQTQGTAGLHVCDLDGDGDLDVLGAVYEENLIVWWENQGFQFVRHTIGSQILEAGSVTAADFDGDGNMDVIGSSRAGHTVSIWWGPIWEKEVLLDNYIFAHEVTVDNPNKDEPLLYTIASDVNDVYQLSCSKDRLWTKNLITDQVSGGKSVAGGFLGGKPVIATASLYSNTIRIHPVIHSEDTIVDNHFGMAHHIQFANLSGGSEKNDLVGAGYAGDIAWWRLDPKKPNHWIRQTIKSGFSKACQVRVGDFDNDGEPDIAATSQGLGCVALWTGKGPNDAKVWTEFILDNNLQGAWPLWAGDFDLDGDDDIVAASGKQGNMMVKWYENTNPKKP